MTRACRRLVAKLLVAAVLYLQLAVAAYACPGFSPDADMPMSAAMDGGMPMDGCAMEDQVQPNLCKQHCEQNSQVLDQSPPAALAAPLLPLLAVADAKAERRCGRSAVPREFLARATAPPSAIRFCVFRI